MGEYIAVNDMRQNMIAGILATIDVDGNITKVIPGDISESDFTSLIN